MKKIDSYVIKEFVKPLIISVLAFGMLVMISEFFRDLGYYLEKKANFGDVIFYLFLNLPWWTVQIMPVSVLLAVLFSLGGLSRSGEITALKAQGVDVWRVIRVLLLCGVIIGIFEIWLRDKVIPITVKRAEIVRIEKILKENFFVRTDYSDVVIAIPPDAMMTVGFIDAKEKKMAQIVIDYLEGNYKIKRQIIASEGVFQNGAWILKNGVERQFNEKFWDEKPFSERAFTFPFEPKDFVIENVRPEQMSNRKFKEFVWQLQTLGIPAARELIQYYSRFAQSVSYIIVMLIGIPFALSFSARYAKMLSFTFALVTAFIYWGITAVGESLGANGYIPPLLAAWLGNIIFTAAGVYFSTKIQR
jgi:lipopolysaccharide export system permease protein